MTIVHEEHKGQKGKKRKMQLIIFGSLALVIVIGALLYAYTEVSNSRVYIENSSISAPLINLSPTVSGQLQALYVSPGDAVLANEPVALVGTQVLKAKVAGLIVSDVDTVGASISPGQTVVTMIDPTQLRVVGQIDENKGLDKVVVGDPVVFTADAFGSEKFNGVVDEISPTANSSDIVFSVSDAREEQTFDVKVRFDTAEYSMLKNGMSAKMYVYTAPK